MVVERVQDGMKKTGWRTERIVELSKLEGKRKEARRKSLHVARTPLGEIERVQRDDYDSPPSSVFFDETTYPVVRHSLHRTSDNRCMRRRSIHITKTTLTVK